MNESVKEREEFYLFKVTVSDLFGKTSVNIVLGNNHQSVVESWFKRFQSIDIKEFKVERVMAIDSDGLFIHTVYR